MVHSDSRLVVVGMRYDGGHQVVRIIFSLSAQIAPPDTAALNARTSGIIADKSEEQLFVTMQKSFTIMKVASCALPLFVIEIFR